MLRFYRESLERYAAEQLRVDGWVVKLVSCAGCLPLVTGEVLGGSG
jgi:hypothetical protein